MSSLERPAKRTRQACEPCRRKKSRCTGERPACSLCARLGQACSYALETSRVSTGPIADASQPETPENRRVILGQGMPHSMAERVEALEASLAAMQDSMKHQIWTTNQQLSTPSPQTSTSFHTFDPPRTGNSQTAQLLSSDAIATISQLYLNYCNCQPLALFTPKAFVETIGMRDPEVVFAILALAVRFSNTDGVEGLDKRYADEANSLVMKRLLKGPVELSTIQTLCMLSLYDFTNGSTARASMHSSLAMDLAQSAGLASEDHNQKIHADDICEERRRCYWSVSVLKNLYANSGGTFSFISDEQVPSYPRSEGAPSELDNVQDISDQGIVTSVIQLTKVWQRAARYARRRGKIGPVPDWSAHSEYSEIISQLMELETQIPTKYRFRASRFADQTPEELQRSRSFWAPWLLTQVLYHTILCTLNHPLLLSLRLRNFQVTNVPEIYLQQTADLIGTHTDWMIHLLDLLNTKQFEVSDPFLAHGVAIVATIYLQQSCTDVVPIRTTKQENFQKCLAFIRKLGERWPYIDQLAQKIQEFEKVVSSSFQNIELYNTPEASVFIDLSLFWDIMESSFANELPRTDSYFGSSLTSHRPASTSAEIVQSQLLPEPTRLGQVIQEQANGPSFDNQLAILAQSYFAQGQDFVGNMDDWWSLGQSL